jgi:hypothetical protein
VKVLLHIGQSKTGTSAIQAFLTLNRGKLRENGILYPAIRVNGMPLNLGAHNTVSDALLDCIQFPHVSADEYFKQFFGDAEGIQANLLILSAEHFFGGEPRIWAVRGETQYFELYKKKIERLAGYLKGHDVSILIYLRPQIDWFASAVSQTVRIERLISERRIYQNDRQFFELMKPLLKYADLLDAWQEIIKPSSFSVIPYIRNALFEKSSVGDFLKRTGLDHIAFDYGSSDLQVNESLNREFIEVKKILNRTPRSKNEERTIIRCMESLSRANPGSTQYVLDPDVRSEIEAFVSQQNERISVKYMKDGMTFSATSGSRAPEEPPGEEEVNRAMQSFEDEFSRPKYIILRWNFAIRAFLRTHIKPLQAALHQLKVLYWAVKHRN